MTKGVPNSYTSWIRETKKWGLESTFICLVMAHWSWAMWFGDPSNKSLEGQLNVVTYKKFPIHLIGLLGAFSSPTFKRIHVLDTEI